MDAGAASQGRRVGGADLSVEARRQPVSKHARIVAAGAGRSRPGVPLRFVPAGGDGELAQGRYRVLILPRSSAMRGRKRRRCARSWRRAECCWRRASPAAFDEHARRLAAPQLADVFRAAGYGRGRALRTEAGAAAILGAGVRPEFPVTDERGRTAAGLETRVFRNGAVTLVGLLSNEAAGRTRAVTLAARRNRTPTTCAGRGRWDGEARSR